LFVGKKLIHLVEGEKRIAAVRVVHSCGSKGKRKRKLPDEREELGVPVRKKGFCLCPSVKKRGH